MLQKLSIAFFSLFLFSRCAQVGQLDGGPTDEVAPIPDSAGIFPKNASTNIFPKKIAIPFNEFIRINNPQKNVIIVPKVTPTPEYKIKGKTFYIEFADSSLQTNTTYAIYLNGAIQDITEGNDSLMSYVFSTGSVIDSLRYNVLVKDAFKNTPVEGVTVGLYPLSDSLDPYKQNPLYFSKTDASGLAPFYYLSKKELSVFAFNNTNGLLKPMGADPVAFKIESITPDTLVKTDTLFLFGKKSEKLRIVKKNISLPGKIELVTTRSLDSAKIQLTKDSLPVDFKQINTNRKDSTFIWFKGEENKSYVLSVNWPDTALSTRLLLRKGKTVKNTFSSNIQSKFLGRFDTLTLVSAFPLDKFKDSLISLKEDSIPIKVKIEKQSSNTLIINNQWFDEKHYDLLLYPGAISDYYGAANTDTLHFSWQLKPTYKLSNLILHLDNRPPTQLIVQLLQGDKQIAEYIPNVSDTLVKFNLLEPTDYSVRVVLDENQNKKWDTGNYPLKVQPEKVLWFREPIKLRPNWDFKVALKFEKK